METRTYIRQLVAAGAVAASFALATGSPATAGGCSSNVSSGGGSSAVQQYVEQLPTACGNQATGTGSGETKLPKSIERKIDSQAGSQAPILKKLATSKAYGAPQRAIKSKQSTKKTKHYRRILGDAKKQSNALSASIGVVADGSDARLLTLLLVMIVTAVVVLGAAIRRRRVTR
jgi:hypothetical protein